MQGGKIIIIIIANMMHYPRHGLLFFCFHTILPMALDQAIEKMRHCTGVPLSHKHTHCVFI